MIGVARAIGRAAVAALRDELATAPKPGLVTFRDCGSHVDMDAATFEASRRALGGFFAEAAAAGLAGAPFAALRALGLDAERRMLRATGGVNTHRGAIHRPGWRGRAEALHRTLVARNLSPGGSADLLAAALLVRRLRGGDP